MIVSLYKLSQTIRERQKKNPKELSAMGKLDNKVAIITGAAQGMGAMHANSRRKAPK